MSNTIHIKDLAITSKAHILTKLALYFSLSLVIIVDSVSLLSCLFLIILLLCILSVRVFYYKPWKFGLIIIVFLFALIYGWRLQIDNINNILFAAKLISIIALSFLFERSFCDREIMAIAGRAFGPLLIGALSGMQKMPEINRQIAMAQIVHGLYSSQKPQLIYRWITARSYALLTNIALLSESISWQYKLRQYASIRRGSIWGTKFSLYDYFLLGVSSMILSAALYICVF